MKQKPSWNRVGNSRALEFVDPLGWSYYFGGPDCTTFVGYRQPGRRPVLSGDDIHPVHHRLHLDEIDKGVGLRVTAAELEDHLARDLDAARRQPYI